MNEETKRRIETAIKAFSKGNLTQNALDLFQTLGYTTDRQASLAKPTYAQFKELFISADSRFNEDKALTSQWKYVDLLFQLTKDEVSRHTSLFDTKQVDRTIIEAYLFFVIELVPIGYSRTALSHITREVNRLFPMPVMILFKYGSELTLSVIDRRLHKRNELKDVLEKVTLIKDMQIEKLHRGHKEILCDLSFNELLSAHEITNFVELHEAWQKTLNTKLLNKKFFEELSNWYFWAQQSVKFPNDKRMEDDKNVQINLIRLVTRLIFVWFLKEKKLVPEILFDGNRIKPLLKSFDCENEKGKTYYTAILQNLFFATLNQKMDERDFIVEGGFEENRNQYGIKNLYRYFEQFQVSKKEVIQLFKDIPFLNGGLFDCLDKENEDTGKVEYIDGFSRNAKKVPTVPDFLFFGKERILDLSEGYGYKRNKEKCRGLFELFANYKFTIEENTPIEEEIALDPELLGKVFENLLAYYVPETELTARKQTGSFYTPREIVNHMVDESLTAYLKTQMLEDKPGWIQLGNLQAEMFGNEVLKGQLELEHPLSQSRWKGKEDNLETNLRKLIAYRNDEQPFSDEADIQQLIYAIDHCKILDPACGSGAFPMGILHKLVFVLGKMDKDNVRWRELQKRKVQMELLKAPSRTDKRENEERLIDLNESFEDNASDYGRKLYLIENCIYGVDIQPIAVQISKLRFFISLVVDQKESGGAINRGIRPLPNLETKFVAANTLVGLEKPAQLPIGYDIIEPLQEELRQIRHRHFEAKSRRDKIRCQKEDRRIRKTIAEKLRLLGFANKDADKVAAFDIYDQNASADWFEPEWMFGKHLSDGFDIIIANPPYIFTRDADFSEEFKTYIANRYFSLLSSRDRKSKANQSGKINLFALFVLRGLFDSRPKGVFTYILPNNVLRSTIYDLIRKYLLEHSTIEELVDLGSGVFDNVTASTIILRMSNKINSSRCLTKIITNIKDIEKNEYDISTIDQKQFLKNVSYTFNLFADKATNELLTKIAENKTDLGKYCVDIIEGIVAHKHLIGETKSKNSFPLLEGKTIKRYGLKSVSKFITWDVEEIHRTRPDYLWNAPKKIVIQRISGGNSPLTATLDKKKFKTFASINNLLLKPEYERHYEFILALINSKILNWYYANSFSNNSELTVNISKTFLEKLPIIDFDSDKNMTIGKVVNYVMTLNEEKRDTTFFERLIDAMIYELYFPKAMLAANCGVLKYLTDIPELKEEWIDEKKLKTIERVHKELSSSSHPVSTALHKLLNVEEVMVIEGRK